MATANAIRAAYDERLSGLGLTLSLASLISYVADFGPVNQTRVAEHLGQGRAVTGTHIDRLESQGLVERLPDAARPSGLARGDHTLRCRPRSVDRRGRPGAACRTPRRASPAPIARRSPTCSCACNRTSTDQPTSPDHQGATHMTNAVIIDAVRTPGGRRNGMLKDWHPADLAAHVLKALQERNDLDPAIVDDVIMGCVMQVGEQSLNIGRNAVLDRRLARVGARHHRRPPVRFEPAGAALRRAGRDGRRLRRRRRSRRRGDDPHADGRLDRQGHGLPVPAADARPLRRTPGFPRRASAPR